MRVCLTTFIFLHDIGLSAFKAIKKSYREDGLVPRVHGNKRRAPVHALTFQDVKHVVSFIDNYAEDHAIYLPGRIPGYKRSDLQLLPCSTTKRSVWQQYVSATSQQQGNVHSASYTSFCRIWQQLKPNILSTTPMTDLCAICHRNAGLIMRSSNLSEEEKTQVSNCIYTCQLTTHKITSSQTLKSYEEHLLRAATEHSAYKDICEKTRNLYKEHKDCSHSLPASTISVQGQSNSVVAETHYSFDFAQQVHIPSDPLQPGPMYFLTPRKCALFGICCEAIPRQVRLKEQHILYV